MRQKLGLLNKEKQDESLVQDLLKVCLYKMIVITV